MTTITSERLDILLSDLGTTQNELQHGGYELAAQLLAMASIQIRLQRYEISDHDFNEFCRLLELQPLESHPTSFEHRSSNRCRGGDSGIARQNRTGARSVKERHES